jgi:hypothetical protein
MAEDLTATEKLVFQTLAAKPFFRAEMAPVLVRILDTNCRSHDHRRRVCEAAILRRFGSGDNPEDRCPGPAELVDLIEEIPSYGVRRPEAKLDCEFCHGDGFEPVGINSSKPCRCGGRPMSDESRLEAYRREAAKQAETERRAHAERFSNYNSELRSVIDKQQR